MTALVCEGFEREHMPHQEALTEAQTQLHTANALHERNVGPAVVSFKSLLLWAINLIRSFDEAHNKLLRH